MKEEGEKKNNPTGSCKPVSVTPFAIPYLERERYTLTYALLVPGEMLKYISGPG